jgi:(2Fe-2S) ferredoxin
VPGFQRHVFVCINERPADNPKGSCKPKGGEQVRDALKKALGDRGINKLCRANNAGCLDQCATGVSVVVYPEQVWYGHVTVDDIPELVEKHIIGGEFVERLMLPDQPHLGGKTSAPPLEIPTGSPREPKP